MQQTLVILKPDTIKRGLIGTVMQRFENKGLKLVACEMRQLDEAVLKEHYAHLADKPFFPSIVEFMTMAPVLVQIWEGTECIDIVRQMIGVTNGRKALPGTIRGDFSISIARNIVHASEDEAAAKDEIARFFGNITPFSYTTDSFTTLYEEDER